MTAQRSRGTAVRAVAALSVAGLLAASLSACSKEGLGLGRADADNASPSSTPEPKAVVTSNVVDRNSVAVDKKVTLQVTGGRFTSVAVKSEAATLEGQLSPDGTVWEATGRLEPGTTYDVTTVTATTAGAEQKDATRFTTEDLSLSQQTYASIAPLDGETVGVGMPVIVTFDVPVTNKVSIEKHLQVTSRPAQAGSWHWIGDFEVHWRPEKYWQAGTDVSVDVDINSVRAGDGVYGQESRHIDFHVGAANVYKVSAVTHQMQVFSNGRLLRTLPITTGKAGFTTRSGTKVIIEKFRRKRMNSETVGIAQGDPEAYDIDDVEYAMRLTFSGEFIHAAPWSVGSQGRANVSHGCTGMSPADAGWLYAMSKRGDVVEYTGTDRYMTLTNGWGDWNTSYADYQAGSAL